MELTDYFSTGWLGVDTVRAYHRAAEQWGVLTAMVAPLALFYIVAVIVISRLERKK